MKGHKSLLKAIALNPFHPLYNLGDKKYSLVSEGDFFTVGECYLVEEKIEGLDLPSFMDITSVDFNSLVLPANQSPLSDVDKFTDIKEPKSLIMSYLVSSLLGQSKDDWWIDTVINELGEDFNLEYLLAIQEDYRNLLYEIMPDLKIYIPYHWVELALITSKVSGENMVMVDDLVLSDKLKDDERKVINREFQSFKKSIIDKKLSNHHKESIVKHMILAKEQGKLQFGLPFPFDTKSKKVERVSIKLIKIAKKKD